MDKIGEAQTKHSPLLHVEHYYAQTMQRFHKHKPTKRFADCRAAKEAMQLGDCQEWARNWRWEKTETEFDRRQTTIKQLATPLLETKPADALSNHV